MSALMMVRAEQSAAVRSAQRRFRTAARSHELDVPALLEAGRLPAELDGIRAFDLMTSGPNYPGCNLSTDAWLNWLNIAAARTGISLLQRLGEMPPEHHAWLATMWRRRHETGEDR